MSNDSSSSRRSLPERLSFGIAIAILSVLISLVVYSWRTQSNKPPILSVEIGQEIRYIQAQYYVPFTVINEGEQAVSSVQVIGQLTIGEKIEQRGEQQIDFLSRGEKVSGAFIFTHNPKVGELTIRVSGYKLP